GVLQSLDGIQISAVAQQLETLVVVAKGRDGLRAGLERAGFELFEYVRRDGQVGANQLGELVHCLGKLFFAGRGNVQRNAAIMFEILKSGVDANLIAELDVTAPDKHVRIREFREPAKRVRIQICVWRDAQIFQDLEQAIGGNRAKVGGLT